MDDCIDYRSLSLTPHQIRLIKVEPRLQVSAATTAEDVPLVCSLETYTRGDCPPYIALSYAWGSDRRTLPVIINEKQCQVSETVAQALRQLSQEADKHRVWIDQICINQQDNPEKTHQVQGMRQIYNEADYAIAWLGPGFEQSVELFKYLNELGTALLKSDWDQFVSIHQDAERLAPLKEAFTRFSQRLYWKRLWIIQEFAIAKKVRLACGSSHIEEEVIHAALTMLDPPTDIGESESQIKSMLAKIQEAFSPEERSYVDNVITRRRRHQHLSGNDKDAFIRVLTTSLVLEVDYNMMSATDARDRVFGLLYLATDTKDFENLVDYTKTTEQVYCETAVAFLNQGNIDMMQYCQFPKQLNSLPSWVPDWSMGVRNPCAQAPWFSNFCASGDTSSQQKISYPCPGGLQLLGVSIDTVKEFGAPWDPNWLKSVDPKAAMAFIDEVMGYCKKSPRINWHDEVTEAARIATMDAAYFTPDYTQYTRGAYLDDFVYGFNRLKETIDSGEDAENNSEGETLQKGAYNSSDDWFLISLHRMHSRRPFITRSGYIGLCPDHVQAGDEVIIFYGGCTPYLLRPGNDSTHTLIGEAYVHGAMYGEYLKGEPETKNFVLE